MRTKRSLLILLALLGALASSYRSSGGLATRTGKEWHLWSEGKFSVVVARVAEIRPAPPDSGDVGLYLANLEPLATLAGALDPSEHSVLHVQFHAGGYGSSITALPSKGGMVLAVF